MTKTKTKKKAETMPEGLGVSGANAWRAEHDPAYIESATTPPDLKRGPIDGSIENYDDTDQYVDDGTATKPR